MWRFWSIDQMGLTVLDLAEVESTMSGMFFLRIQLAWCGIIISYNPCAVDSRPENTGLSF